MMNGNTTFEKFRDTCLTHQKQNKDCETCSQYKFCTYEMSTNYPSGWELSNDVEEPNILHVKESNNVFIICNRCYHKIRDYDLSPFYPNVEDINKKLVESPKDLYPNYCENCGVKLK